MDEIWDRNPGKSESLAVVAVMKKPNGHAEPTKVELYKNRKKTKLALLFVSILTLFFMINEL